MGHFPLFTSRKLFLKPNPDPPYYNLGLWFSSHPGVDVEKSLFLPCLHLPFTVSKSISCISSCSPLLQTFSLLWSTAAWSLSWRSGAGNTATHWKCRQQQEGRAGTGRDNNMCYAEFYVRTRRLFITWFSSLQLPTEQQMHILDCKPLQCNLCKSQI